MNTNDYCSYELSLKFKDCGFNEPCDYSYFIHVWMDKPKLVRTCEAENEADNFDGTDIYDAVSLWQAQKWLREKSGIHIDISPFYVPSTDVDNKTGKELHFWAYDLISVNTGEQIHECYKPFGTYEATLSAGIEAALNLLARKEIEK